MNHAQIKKLFSHKKITLMGLGLLGRGIGDAEFLAGAGADLIVTDLKSEADLALSLERLREFPNIACHLGGHRLEDFEDRDMIVRAPNVPARFSLYRPRPRRWHSRRNGRFPLRKTFRRDDRGNNGNAREIDRDAPHL